MCVAPVKSFIRRRDVFNQKILWQGMCVIFVKPPGYSLKIALWHNPYFLASTIGGYYTMLPVYERLHWWQTLSLAYVELPVIHAGKGFSVQCMWCSLQHLWQIFAESFVLNGMELNIKSAAILFACNVTSIVQEMVTFRTQHAIEGNVVVVPHQNGGVPPVILVFGLLSRDLCKRIAQKLCSHDMVVTWEIVEFGAEYADKQ